MSIVTQQMLENRIGAAELIRLTDDAATGSVNTATMNRAIAEGEGELLNSIAQRWVVPLSLGDSNAAAAVTGMMLDAVVYRLYMRRDHKVSVEHADAYKHAANWSKDIAAGKIGLVGETARERAPGQAARVIVSKRPRVIGRDTMEGL